MSERPPRQPKERRFRAECARFKEWMLWLRAAYPEKYSSDAALARALGMNKAGLSLLLSDPDRKPSFDTLLAMRALTGAGIDLMLTSPPPSAGNPAPASGPAQPRKRAAHGGR